MASSGTDSSGQNQSIKVGSPLIYNLPAPASYGAASQSYTAADIVGGIIVHASGGAAGNLPTAAAIAAILRGGATPLNIGDTIECLICNGGAGSITLGLATGVTNDANGTLVIPTLTSKYCQFRFTGTTPGAETCVLYS